VDGAHIRTLILTLLYRYFKPVIDGGYIYIAQPPLYKVKRGKEVMYFYSEEEKTKVLGKDEIPLEEEMVEGDVVGEMEETEASKGKKATKVHVQRYKGLGEMNADELWETTMDPNNRVLKKVRIEDAIDADKIFDMLMGTDVPSRKSFIQSNAHKARVDV
jgi:DNA gyrase subunit B